MDPTVEVLTIYPAAWAALFQGLAESLIYGLAGMAAAALLATVSIVCLGNLAGRASDVPDRTTLTALVEPPAEERPAIVQLAVVRQQRLRRVGSRQQAAGSRQQQILAEFLQR